MGKSGKVHLYVRLHTKLTQQTNRTNILDLKKLNKSIEKALSVLRTPLEHLELINKEDFFINRDITDNREHHLQCLQSEASPDGLMQ